MTFTFTLPAPKVFDFDKQRKIGEEGARQVRQEILPSVNKGYQYLSFNEIMANPHISINDKEKITGNWDQNNDKDCFVFRGNKWLGFHSEIKTDTYCSGNFFIERYSDVDLKTAGGPWQAKDRGDKFYVYYFMNMSRLYVFGVSSLLEAVEELRKTNFYKSHEIKNKGWVTQGWTIPIEHITKNCKAYAMYKKTAAGWAADVWNFSKEN